MKKRTEIYLLSGFLGSGKTTLLKRLLQHEKMEGRKVAVLMNELGSVSIDSDAIEEGVPLRELLDGCICCSIQDKLESQIQGLLMEEKPEVIYIEATGAAHPVEVIDAIVSPLFADAIVFKGIITVVDGKRWMERGKLSLQIQQLILEQVKYAKIILINKTDTCQENELAKLSMEMNAINPHAPAILTSFSKVPMEKVQAIGLDHKLLHDHHTHLNIHLHAFVYCFKNPINQTEFEDFLRKMPDTIYRIKGYVKFSNSTYPLLFQYSYGMPLYMKEYMNMPLNLVLIGENIDWNNIQKQLEEMERN